jgi:hypothetical protein
VGFGYRKSQAFTSADWNDKQREAFANLIKEFDGSSPKWSCERLARELEGRVYALGERTSVKYQAVCVKTIGPACAVTERRIELRAHGPQRSVDELIQQGELYQRRIAALKKDPSLAGDYKPRATKMTTEEMADSFLSYVRGAGLDVNVYSGIVRERKLYDLLQAINSGKCRR